jgi:hypothetical protein
MKLVTIKRGAGGRRGRGKKAGPGSSLAGAACWGRTTLRRACGYLKQLRERFAGRHAGLGILARQAETISSKAAGQRAGSRETVVGSGMERTRLQIPCRDIGRRRGACR